MLPSYARVKHGVVEERLLKLQEFAETFPGNRIEINDPAIGIITAGYFISVCKGSLPELFLPETGDGLAASQKFDRPVLQEE